MRLYRLLLHLYPRSFRNEYGGEMTAIFARRLRDASGPAARASLWIETIGGTLRDAVLVHAELTAQDARHAVRALGHARGFAASAVLVTALGVGATTAVFSVADHVLLRPLPFAEPDRLVRIWQDQSSRGYSRMELSPGNYRDWKAASGPVFASVSAFTGVSMNLTGHALPERLEGTRVTPEIFRTLGVHARVGRTLLATDERGPAAVVISTSLWERLFGSDPAVVGRTLVLDQAPHVVVGVMPAGFHFPERASEFWVPLAFEPADYEDRANRFLRAVGRLAPGASIAQADAQLDAVAARLAREFPDANAETGATIVGIRDEIPWSSRGTVAALAAAAALLLVITCLNLTNLLLARSVQRDRELSVRAALGAGAERLFRQQLTESAMVALAGSLFGVALAATAVPLVARLVPTMLPVADVPPLDARLLGIAAVVTAVTALGFGLLPALRASRGVSFDALRGGPRVGPGRGAERLRSGVVVAEVAASVVLLVSAGLLLNALWRVQRIDPGFRPEGVITARTALPLPAYASAARKRAFYDRVLAEVRALPGVSAAAYTSFLPMVMRGGVWPVTPEGQADDPSAGRSASLRLITPDYFAALGIPVRQGRVFEAADARDGTIDPDPRGTLPVTAIVSESFVRSYLPNGQALGRRFRMQFMDATIVGVVGDVKVRGLERQSEPQVYLPAAEIPDGALIFYAPKDLAIRTSGDPLELAPTLRRIVARADPLQPVSDVRTLTEVVETETGVRRTQLRVLWLFAGVAVLLAAVGIHGLLAYVVSSRMREIGVRIALGATRGAIVRLVLGRGILLAGGGVALGAIAGTAAGRALHALLAGVSPADPATIAGAVLLSLGMAIAGSAWPALRASRIDPAQATRME